MPNELVPITQYLKFDISTILPTASKNQNERTSKSIQNAWGESIYLDQTVGSLYVKAEKLHTILRTGKKANAQYLVQTMPEESKKCINNEVYIAAYEIIKILEKRIQETPLKTREYLAYSQNIYTNVRELGEIKYEQQKIKETYKEMVKKLKNDRIKKMRIQKDELTGQKLEKKTAEFAHIRSQTMYIELAAHLHNGLIVNRKTHEMITQKDIHHEDQLFDLCIKMQWSTRWYEPYKARYSKNK